MGNAQKSIAVKLGVMVFVTLTSLLACAKHESEETTNDYLSLKDKRDFYVSEVRGDPYNIVSTTRCDTLPFFALASAFGGDLDLGRFEWSDGEWHRHYDPCFEVGDSKSEVSFDGIVAVLNDAVTKKDRELIRRMQDYGDANTWVMGSGDRELTHLPQLNYMLSDLLSNLNMFQKQGSYLDYEGSHREHILGIAALLKLRYAGFLESQDLLVLKNLKQNPLIKAILNRTDDGNQSEIIELMSDESIFPSDRYPKGTAFGWGSSTLGVYYLVLYGVINGQ